MSTGLILVVTGIYVVVALNEAVKGNYPSFTIFGAYAVANLGLIWSMK